MKLYESIYKKKVALLFEDEEQDVESSPEPEESSSDDSDSDTDLEFDSGGDDLFGSSDSGGGGGDDLFGSSSDSESEEVPEEAEKKEPEQVDSLSTQEEVSAIQLGVDSAIDDAIMASTIAATAIIEEGSLKMFSSIFETEEVGPSQMKIDINKFASKIANLMQNYTTVLDVPGMIYQTARTRLLKDFGQDWQDKFEEIISGMQISVPIGYGSSGPVASKPIGNAVNPQNVATGNVFVTSTGGSAGG